MKNILLRTQIVAILQIAVCNADLIFMNFVVLREEQINN